MAWIESHQGLVNHPKTKKLIRKLGLPGPHVVGHLHYLWWWALDFAQDGEITQYDSFDIADACEWKGDPNEFYNALIDVGFVDLEDDRCFIHDWYDYAGKLIEIRKKDADRKRNSRGKQKDSKGHPADIQRTSEGRRTESIRDLNLNLDLNLNQDKKREEKGNETAPGPFPELNNPHEQYITELLKKYSVSMDKPYQTEQFFSYIGAVDIEVIEAAIKKSAGKGISYALGTLEGMVKDGITKESLKQKVGGNNGATESGLRHERAAAEDKPITGGAVGWLPSKYNRDSKVIPLHDVSG